MNHQFHIFQGTWMLTTSSIVKAVQVCSSKALAAVQAIVAITMKIATEKSAIGKNLDLGTPQAKMSLQHIKKGYISEISKKHFLKSSIFSEVHSIAHTSWQICTQYKVLEMFESIPLLTQQSTETGETAFYISSQLHSWKM